MRRKQVNPSRVSRKLKQYSPESIGEAFKAVKEKKMSVAKAARLFKVPEQTLRDRVLNKISLESSMGREKLFTFEEEQLLVNHLCELAKVGYGLCRSQFNLLATEMAKKLGKISDDKNLSSNWYYSFLKRWKDQLKVVSPRALCSTRAASLTDNVVTEYFDQLSITMDKYNLHNKPHLIYNIDETGLQPEHRPPHVITGKQYSKTQAIVSPKSTTVTLIACVNAAGTSLPPFFIFKGKRPNEDLLQDSIPGSSHAMSDSGWSNGTIFMQYLQDHFRRYAQIGACGDNNDHILLILDGHASHVSLYIIQWAKENRIILFVLPPHSSHALQPLDVGCFGPFKSMYYSFCNLQMANERGSVISRYDVAKLSGRAYQTSMTPKNICSSFKKCGIFPLTKAVISRELIEPAVNFKKSESLLPAPQTTMKELLQQQMNKTGPKEASSNISCTCSCKCKKCSPEPKLKKPKLSGKAITEDSIVEEMEKYHLIKNSKPTKNNIQSQEPTTSTGKVSKRRIINSCSEDAESENDSESESDKCCVCGKFSPPDLKNCVNLIIVKWAECSKCGHWVHLRFCSSVVVVRRHADFFCPHCK